MGEVRGSLGAVKARFVAMLRESGAALMVFAVVIALQGAYYIHSIGALTMPDPGMHARAAYALATGQVLNPLEDRVDVYGNVRHLQTLTGDARLLRLEGATNAFVSDIIAGAFPTDPSRELQSSVNSQDGETIVFPRDVKETPPDPEAETTAPEATVYGMRGGNQYFPLAWLPQAIGVRIGLSLGLEPYSVWQLGRVTSLVAFVALYGLAIALMPRMKSFLVVIGLLPTTVFVASSLMCDGFLLALCALSASLTLRALARGGHIGASTTLGLGAVAALVVLCKPVYAPACMGFLLFPANRTSLREKAVGLVPTVVGVVVYLTWSALLGDMMYNCNVSLNASLIRGDLVGSLVRVLYNLLNLPMLLSEMDASYLLAAIVVALVFVVGVGRIWLEGGMARGDASSHRFAVGALAAWALSVGGTFFFLLLTWNDVSAQATLSLIEGFQGRYLIPLYPLLCYAQAFSYLRGGRHSGPTARGAGSRAATVPQTAESPAAANARAVPETREDG